MRWRNPWLGALWAIGVLLILGALGARVWLSSFYFPPLSTAQNGPVLSFFMQLADMMVLPGLLVGFGTLAGLLFLQARNHARRDRSPQLRSSRKTRAASACTSRSSVSNRMSNLS